jgi:hypothetical protein
MLSRLRPYRNGFSKSTVVSLATPTVPYPLESTPKESENGF